MTPTHIVLERTAKQLLLRVYVPDMTEGSTVMESVPLRDGDGLPTLRKQAADFANLDLPRFGGEVRIFIQGI
jgi:hypothetical protein